MTYIYDIFNNKSHIIINSPKPEDLNSSKDILAILLYEFPTLNPNYVIVSNPHESFAVCVGDNLNYKGKILIQIKKNTKLLKGENIKMPQHAETTQLSNYTLLKLIRIGIAPLSAMIGTSAYYGQLIGNTVLGSINALLFSKKLGIDIWNLNQIPSIKTKLLNSSKKILLGLGTIGLVNYSKFVTNDINPNPTESPITTTVNPFPDLLFSNPNNTNNHLMDWDTYISLNSYGISNLINGITELIPNRFETIRKIANMATGGCLISSGVAMGINNDFNNAYAVPTIVAGASEIIHNLLPMETTYHNQEMQETPFNNETARLINDNRFTINSETSSQYGSDNMSEVPLNHDNASLNWDYNHMSL